jgi:glutathione S-transferase
MTQNLKLIIGDKNRSSWSFRPWLLLKEAGIPFEETLLHLGKEGDRAKIDALSPSGKVPLLIDGDVKIWESTAICEYVAEKYPEKNLWPRDPKAKALARSVSHEMHAGFLTLRKNMPFSCTDRFPGWAAPDDVKPEIDRIVRIWEECRAKYAVGGPFLFGDFSVADAMYAPVAIRFLAYNIKLPAAAKNYQETILARPAVKEWIKGATAEGV